MKIMHIRRQLRLMGERLPFIRPVAEERDRLRAVVRKLGFPPGHFHSPIPSLDEIRQNEDRIFGDPPRQLPAIDLREAEQLQLCRAFTTYYKELPFTPQKVPHLRYFYENAFYPYADAISLYCMIRHVQPQRIIEVGSGYSSCVILDTNELFFDNTIETVFIDPYPQQLLSLINETDKQRVRIIAQRLQDVALTEFAALSDGDMLFIDSTHVSKVGSDVNRIFFDILPSLNAGVYIHFHDVFFPFEYPKQWIYKGWVWNEGYLLRAFLQYNDHFEITLFNTFIEHFYEEWFRKEMPLYLMDRGCSIWIRKKQR